MISNRWFQLGLFSAFAFLLGFSYQYHLPKLEAFLLLEVERLSKKHSPIRVWAKKLDFHLVPLGVVLKDVRLLAKAPIDSYLAPTQLKEAGARLAILPLLRGEVRLSQVFIRESEVNLFLRKELFENQGTGKDLQLNFDVLYNLPIDELLFENVVLQGRIEPKNMVFRASNLNLSIENRFRSLYVDIQSPEVMVKPSGPIAPLNAQLELRALFEARELQISAFKLKVDETFAVASGRFNGDLAAGRLDNGALDARIRTFLPDVNRWEDLFFEQTKIPRLKGQVDLDLGVELRGGKVHSLHGEINTKDVNIDRFVVGNVKGKAQTDLKTITSDEISVSNSAGTAKVRKLSATLHEKPVISGKVIAQTVEIQRLLENLGAKNIPFTLPIKGEVDCQANFKEKSELACRGAITSTRFYLHTGKPRQGTIVDAENLRAKGEFKVTPTHVEYDAELEAGKKSKAKTKGTIHYEKGFLIEYDAPEVSFADVKNFVDLKFEGDLALKGKTEGTSRWGTIDMRIQAQNFWLQDYPFGQLSADLKYRKGLLSFENGEGQYEVSRYNGSVVLDFPNEKMKIQAQIPFADLKDVQGLFQRKIKFPFEANGTGTASLKAEGPARLQDMTYQLRSSFYRGQIADETFDELVFDVSAVNGLVKSDRVFLKKSNGTVDLKGQITPKGEIDTVVVGRALRLEQSENLIGLGFDLQGLADLTMLIRGQLPKPRIELNGRLSRVVMADQAAEDSVFKLNFLQDRMEGSGQFLGTTLVSDFVFPYEDKAPFLLKLKTKKWDFTTLFSLVSKSAKQMDFSTSLSMDMNIASPSGGVWNSTGQIIVDEFIIKKGSKSMASDKPMLLSLREGTMNSSRFSITSGDSYLKLAVTDLTRKNLNASLDGKLDMSLLGLFTPFISDLRGNMAVSMDLKGSAERPSLSGSAYIDRGYAKFAEFFHPFSNVRADILFNDNQILLNTVNGELAGGKFSGEGKIGFAGQNHPVDIRANFGDVKLNIPEGFRTQGSGTLSIKGVRFPYLMGINYEVGGGEVIYEFTDTSTDNKVKASAYLPKFLNQETFYPFAFDIDVDLKSPVLVNNSLVQANVAGQVKAAGTPDRLLLNGGLTPQAGGKIFFRDVPFEIASGYIEYANAPPNAPKIYVTANARVSESVQDDQQRTTENQYDVNLLVQGRGPTPQIILSSQPALSQREIVSLLALGLTTTALDEGKSSGFQAANTSAALGATILQKAGGRRLKDSLGVDLKVSSSQPTPENASTPKVTLSKQWTPKFGASASSTLQANPSNNVKLEYKMNKNVSVIGSWDGKEADKEQKDVTPNVFGLDLQYKVNFK